MAATGATTTSVSVFTSSSALTNSFGNSASSALAKLARSLTVPVVVSTSLSTLSSVPVAIVVWSVRLRAVTVSVRPARICCHTWARSSSGSTKITEIGCKLRQHHQPGGARGLHIVAGIHQPQADPAGDRCHDMAVQQVDLGVGQDALVREHRATVLLDQILLVGRLLHRDAVLGQQQLVAREVRHRLVQQADVVRERALVLLDGGLVRTRVDLRQELALLHDLALVEADRQQLPVDLGLHGDAGERRHGAEPGQGDRQGSSGDGGGADRLRGGAGGVPGRG